MDPHTPDNPPEMLSCNSLNRDPPRRVQVGRVRPCEATPLRAWSQSLSCFFFRPTGPHQGFISQLELRVADCELLFWLSVRSTRQNKEKCFGQRNGAMVRAVAVARKSLVLFVWSLHVLHGSTSSDQKIHEIKEPQKNNIKLE